MARLMKDSGIKWLGEIPEEWRKVQLGFLYSFSSGDTLTAQNFVDNGPYDVYGANGLRGKYNKTNVHGKHILIGRVGALCGNIHLVNDEIWVTEHALISYKLSNVITDEYASKLLFAMELRNYASGTAQPVIAADKIRKLYVPLPSVDEQQRIASYLDIECSRIDSVIEQTRASIEEYKKLKQAVITQAVTKGIRPNREMKDSGSAWFGRIPADWSMKKIKYIFSINKNIAGKEGYQILSITQRGIKPKDISKNEGQLAENYSNYQLVTIGDFAMNHMDLLTGWVDVSKFNGVTSPDYRVFRLKDVDNNCRKYYLYLLQMCYFNRIFYGLGQGVSGMGRWRLQADKFLNFSISVPPTDEQIEIAEYLDAKVLDTDTLIDKKERLITELESYKKSLIFEFVTGKKEVK